MCLVWMIGGITSMQIFQPFILTVNSAIKYKTGHVLRNARLDIYSKLSAMANNIPIMPKYKEGKKAWYANFLEINYKSWYNNGPGQ